MEENHSEDRLKTNTNTQIDCDNNLNDNDSNNDTNNDDQSTEFDERILSITQSNCNFASN